MAGGFYIYLLFLTSVYAEEYNSDYKTDNNGGHIDKNTERYFIAPHIILPNTKPLEDINKENNKEINDKKESNVKIISNIDSELNFKDLEVIHQKTKHNAPNKKDIDAAGSQVYTSYDVPIYQVYENVMDVPDDRTPAGPIVINYTRRPKLNTITTYDRTPAGPIIRNYTNRPKLITVTASNNKATSNTIDTIKKDNQYKTNVLDVFNNKIRYGDRNTNCNKVTCIFKDIKDYFSGLHTDIVNGLHSLFNLDKEYGRRRIRSASYKK